MKGSSYWVFLCVAEFMHDKFPRAKTKSIERMKDIYEREYFLLGPALSENAKNSETIKRPTASGYVLVTSMP
jgi:hypothetical protein